MGLYSLEKFSFMGKQKFQELKPEGHSENIQGEYDKQIPERKIIVQWSGCYTETLKGWIQLSGLPQPSCVTLDESFGLSLPQFSIYTMGIIVLHCLTGML